MSTAFEDEEMQEILESFLIETKELLELLTSSLIELEKEPNNSDLINKIFRYFHTIKGTSSFMGFDDVSKLTHHAEDLLNKVRRNELAVSLDILDVMLDTRDRLELMVEAINNPEEKIQYKDLIERILALSDKKDDSNQVVEKAEAPKQNSSTLDLLLDNKELFQGTGDFNDEELALLEQAFAEINDSFVDNKETQSTEQINEFTITQDASDEISSITEIVIEKPSIQESEKVEHKISETPTDNTNKQKIINKATTQTETIRIDIKRVESLMDLSGELVLGRNRLSQIVKRMISANDIKAIKNDLIETANQIDHITSEIQTSAMKMRMVPIGRLFQKAPKIVRDLSKEFNKKIELIMEGEDTEVDRGIIEELNDPLVHMLRNSCDHGIESSQERLENGKNEKGTIRIIAYHEGNHIIIKIIDDGKGISPNIILNKAIEKGFVSEEQAKSMSDWEILQLIFKPGFSTAKNVTSVSGRGVGMDVVKSNINKLEGIIEIDSTVGKGSEFIIKLPLTLAIIQGLLVKSSGSVYAIPLSSVLEVVSYDSALVNYVNHNKVIRIRNEVLPLIHLDKITGDVSNNDNNSKYVVNIAVGIDRVGLICEELLGQQEIVIKSLGNYLTNIEGIAGSTIIGDGRVIMILDIPGIINRYKFKTN